MEEKLPPDTFYSREHIHVSNDSLEEMYLEKKYRIKTLSDFLEKIRYKKDAINLRAISVSDELMDAFKKEIELKEKELAKYEEEYKIRNLEVPKI